MEKLAARESPGRLWPMRKTARIKRIRCQTTVVEGFTATYNLDESPGTTSTGEAPWNAVWVTSRPSRTLRPGNRESSLCTIQLRQSVVVPSAASGQEVQPAKILCLGGTHDERVALRERVRRRRRGRRGRVARASPGPLGRGDFVGIYADADHFAEVVDLARVVQNERILQGMPDGVVLLNNDNIDPLGQRPACANGPAATTSSAPTSTT